MITSVLVKSKQDFSVVDWPQLQETSSDQFKPYVLLYIYNISPAQSNRFAAASKCLP